MPNESELPAVANISKIDLLPLLTEPREDLSQEYKNWINLGEKEGQATLAKAAIAIANHGGGFIVIGFEDDGQDLHSVSRPPSFAAWTQDEVNAAIGRYADPKFQVGMYFLQHPDTTNEHVTVSIPAVRGSPVMSTRDCDGIIFKHRCYIRKPGPKSEEPKTGAEWRALIDRCVRSGREDMLDAVRAIITGFPISETKVADENQKLAEFANAARQRWQELVDDLPVDASPRFPKGHYEIAIKPVGGLQAINLSELKERLAHARRVKLTGWSTFLDMVTPGWAPYAHDDFIEAWVGNPVREDALTRKPAHCDFWRADRSGCLYTIRGYSEDGLEQQKPGTCIEVTLPVWRVGEAILFALRFAERFQGVDRLIVSCRFTGLKDRALVSIDGSRAIFGDDRSRTDVVNLSAEGAVEQIRDNLVEFLHNLLKPLYERFNFMQLPLGFVQEELQRLQRDKF